ncbi:MAG: extracellular catalytic domain type 1 short-chain-length polyhydroxyalkanoate depolymerase [Nitrospira sp.]
MLKTLYFTSLVVSLLTVLGGTAPDHSFAQHIAMEHERGDLLERLRERRRAAAEQSKDAAADSKITAPGDYSFSMVHDGLTRLYRVHVPTSYSPSRPTPLVFTLHGGAGNMDYQANDTYYGQISKSEQAGYIVVFPNGVSKFKSGKVASWNAGYCCAAARDQNVDDVGFIRELIKRLSNRLSIDSQRIFANGMSNGGMMSYRLACEMPDVFKAIASVAGTDNTKTCSPSVPISILHIHAKDDELELFNGGAGRKSSMVVPFVSVPDSIAKWVTLNRCSPTPKRVFENSGAYCEAYSQCRNDVEVKLCVTATGGHSWPGGKKPHGDGAASTALSATDVISDFFSSR